MKNKTDKLTQALTGVVGEHQRVIFGTMRQHIRTLDSLIENLDAEISKRFSVHFELLEALETIPGVGERSIQGILAEIGWDILWLIKQYGK